MQLNKVTMYALLGAAVGYFRSRTKKGRPVAAMKGAVVGYLAAAQIAPRLGLSLPAPRNVA